jgi:8-oxo-dGTP pyrophosphatase MutT (NUDIX family)
MVAKSEKVQVWVYRTEPFEVLLLRLCPARGGFWQPVTGSVEPGETAAEAALREAREETGLGFVSGPQPLGFSFEYRGSGPREGQLFHETAFGLEVARDDRPPALDRRRRQSPSPCWCS